jgi:branched-chain amino acid transport system permease protein
MAVNFLLGYTGVLSFGHAAYFGLGAYGAGMTIRYLVPSTGLGLVIGALVGAVAGAVIGPLIVRLRGVYFAMVTIAFGQVFYFIAFRWSPVTGGDDGLTGWTRQPLHLGFTTIDILHNPTAFYYLIVVVFALATGAMAWLLRSPFGRTLIAIRENERRARFLGIPVDQHIWLSWVISCCIVSIAGALYAYLNNFVDPRALYWAQSGDFVIMAVLGGMRSFWGPLIGAAIFVVLQDYLSSVTANWMSFVGLFFVLVVLFFPRGILGAIRRRVAS